MVCTSSVEQYITIQYVVSVQYVSIGAVRLTKSCEVYQAHGCGGIERCSNLWSSMHFHGASPCSMHKINTHAELHGCPCDCWHYCL